jgi:hypothetical protein
MWSWRRIEKICWTDRVKNEEVLHRVKEETIKRWKANWICYNLRSNCNLKRGTEGNIEGTRRQVKSRKQRLAGLN